MYIMKQWVGIILGLIVVVSLMMVYTYRKSNYDITAYTPTTMAPTSNVVAPPPMPTSNVVAPPPMPTSNVVAPPPSMTVLPPIPKVAELPPSQAAATDIEPAYAFEKYAVYGDGTSLTPAPVDMVVPTPKVSTYAPMPTDLFAAVHEDTDAFQEIDFQVVDKYGRETSGDAPQAS